NSSFPTFTFSHLADAFIQSDLQGCIHIFTFTLMAHCTSGAIRGSMSCSRTLRQGIELATSCLLNDFSTYCTTVAPENHHNAPKKEVREGHKVLGLLTQTHTHTHARARARTRTRTRTHTL